MYENMESFGAGRSDRPTAVMMNNHENALMTLQSRSRSATLALDRF